MVKVQVLEVGPAVRTLYESAAATQIARNPLEATLLLKRLGPGLRLADLAPPEKRTEVETLLSAVRSRAEEIFLDWAARREAPDAELRIGLDAYERCASAEMEGVLRELTPAATPRATLEKAVRQASRLCDYFEDDLVARDIGWAMVSAALAAAESYSQPLRRLALRPIR